MFKFGPWGDSLSLSTAKTVCAQRSQPGPWGDLTPSKADKPRKADKSSKADKGPWGETGAVVLDASPGPWGDLTPSKADKPRKADKSSKADKGPWGETGAVVLDAGPWGNTCLASQGAQSSQPRKRARVLRAHRQVGLDFNAGSAESAVRDVLSTQLPRATEATKHEQNGADANKVQQRWQTAGRSCRCGKAAGTCSKHVNLKRLQAVCKEFWSIPAGERGHLLRILYEQQEGSEGSEVSNIGGQRESLRLVAVQWQLCGKRVCFSNFVHLLGTSQNSTRRAIHGAPDRRTSDLSCRPVLSEQSQHVDWFFYELYQSTAEALPEEQCGKVQRKGSVDADILLDESPWSAEEIIEPGPLLSEWSPDQPELDHYVALTMASTSHCIGLPVRRLQHGKLSELYWVFMASWECIQSHNASLGRVPSFSTFSRRWKKWHHVLKFRKSSQHAQCQTCWDLQKEMLGFRGSGVVSWTSRLAAARSLKQHYIDQYLDRCIYWSLRFASRQRGNVLTIIIDTMDRAKFAWPCWPSSRVPHDMMSLHRPRIVITAALVHGYFGELYAATEDLVHGSDAFLDVLP
jgi:hypothetical protein